MRLDPTTLKLFLSAVEEGTLARTAAREHIAVAAVSRRLSDLEMILQTKLLNRSNKGIQPTTAGHTLVHLARRVLHDLDDIYAEMREFSGGTKGFVRLFANLSSITQFLPSELEAFLTKHPQVQITLENRYSGEITRAVLENEADVGLFVIGAPASNLEVFPYRKDELVLLVSKEHVLAKRKSVTVKDILDFDFVGHQAGSWINFQLIKTAGDLGRTLKMRIQVPGYDALSLMVEAGLGIGVLPRTTAAPYLKSLRVKMLRLDEPWTRRELAICVRSYGSLSVAARLLVDHLRKSAHSAPSPKA